MRNTKKNILIILTIGFALLAITGSASATTFYVDDDGTGPYKTIQSAVNVAQDGDTIVVNSGTYKETVTMTKTQLTFQGKSYPKVDGFTTTSYLDENGEVGWTQLENINGFSIMKDGVIIAGDFCTGNIIRNNYFYTKGVEIESASAYNTVIMNNQFNGCGISFKFGGRSGSGVKITGNRISNSIKGIYLESVGLTCDEISGNTISGCNIGLEISGPAAGANLIYNNLFNNTVNVKLQDVSEIGSWNKDPIIQTTNIVGGPYVGGNFWGSPNGNGFSQTQTDSNGDGFADYSYGIDKYKNNFDYHPLVYHLKVPNADFSASITSGYVPLKVTFADKSTNKPTSWKWSFGDGSALVTQYNPTYTYTKAGTYTVKETVGNAAGKDTEIKTNYITVKAAPVKAPVAAFAASPTSGKIPLKVQFTDKSTNGPTSWKWSFGDGTYSTSKSPAHTYKKAGKYTVSLTAKNAKGSNTKTMAGYIIAKK